MCERMEMTDWKLGGCRTLGRAGDGTDDLQRGVPQPQPIKASSIFWWNTVDGSDIRRIARHLWNLYQRWKELPYFNRLAWSLNQQQYGVDSLKIWSFFSPTPRDSDGVNEIPSLKGNKLQESISKGLTRLPNDTSSYVYIYMHIFYIWQKTYIKKSYMNVPIISIYWLHGIFSINDISYHMPTQPPWWPVISRHMPCHANPNQPLRPSHRPLLESFAFRVTLVACLIFALFGGGLSLGQTKNLFIPKIIPKKAWVLGRLFGQEFLGIKQKAEEHFLQITYVHHLKI